MKKHLITMLLCIGITTLLAQNSHRMYSIGNIKMNNVVSVVSETNKMLLQVVSDINNHDIYLNVVDATTLQPLGQVNSTLLQPLFANNIQQLLIK